MTTTEKFPSWISSKLKDFLWMWDRESISEEDLLKRLDWDVTPNTAPVPNNVIPFRRPKAISVNPGITAFKPGASGLKASHQLRLLWKLDSDSIIWTISYIDVNDKFVVGKLQPNGHVIFLENRKLEISYRDMFDFNELINYLCTRLGPRLPGSQIKAQSPDGPKSIA